MDNLQHQAMVKKAVKQHFHGRKSLKSESVPCYPYGSEREYNRIVSAYVKLLNSELKNALPALMKLYGRTLQDKARFDDAANLRSETEEKFQKIAASLEKKLARFELEKFIEKIGSSTKNAAYREWKRIIKSTLGINLMDDYYDGEFYSLMLQRWAAENVQRIKSIPNDTLGELEGLIFDSYNQGIPVRKLQEAIQNKYNVAKQHAQAIARDQIASLNASITKAQQTDAGVKRYKWSTANDQRVRECHQELDGKIFSWDDPPEMWYRSKTDGKVFTGRCCHPGEDICCRCVAIPIFDFETINVPFDNGG